MIRKKIEDKNKHWFALYTRSRCEKIVKRELEIQGIENFFPTHTVFRIYKNQKKKIELPLISSYIFIQPKNHSEYINALEVDAAVRYIFFEGNPAAIPDWQIQNLKKVVEHAADLESKAGEIKEGDEVEIIHGNLKGIKGKLIRTFGKERFVLELEAINQNITMNIPAYQIKKIVDSGL